MNKSDLKLIAVLERTGGFASAQELHQILRREGDGIGLTTVYRALQSLVDDKIVDLLRREDGEAVYRLLCVQRDRALGKHVLIFDIL
jgi:Fur family ferric uptake transcriptional regulator